MVNSMVKLVDISGLGSSDSYEYNVLIVDDQAVNRTTLSSVLASKGFQVSTAKDSSEAFDLAESSMPDVILLDIHMPDMNGLEICKYLKRFPKLAHIPVVFVSSSESMVRSQSMLLRYGAVDIIPKPLKLETIVEKVVGVIDDNSSHKIA